MQTQSSTSTVPLRLTDDTASKRVLVHHHDRLVWGYRYGATPKPYVHPFATPRGEVVSLASPHDHIHHRGLMLAWRVNGINFWEESSATPGEANGVIRHEAWDEMTETPEGVRLTERLSWIDPKGKVHLRERRRLRVQVEEAQRAVRCHWASEFSPDSGDAIISGKTPWSQISYYGLGFRFARALDHGGHHLDSEGRTGQPADNGLPARWHYYGGKLDETATPVGVLIGDSPNNLRHPTPWFHVSQPPAPFAYVTASFIAHNEYRLEAGSTLTLTYAVWVHEGTWDLHQCEERWKEIFAG